MGIPFVALLEWIESDLRTLLDGGANINHQNRQGFTALSLAATSNTLRGEDEARYMAAKWLLEHGANPDSKFNRIDQTNFFLHS